MKTIIICLLCVIGIFTFIKLNESSRNGLELKKLSILEPESSLTPASIDQTRFENQIPKDNVLSIKPTKSKVSSKKEIAKTDVSINLRAEQEILSSAPIENEDPIQTELLKNEFKSEQFSGDDMVKSFNLSDQETTVQSDGIKVLSAKIEKTETQQPPRSDVQQQEIISDNLNEKSGQSINIENIEPKTSTKEPGNSFWENKNLYTKTEETSGSILVDNNKTAPVLPVEKKELIIVNESIETNIVVNNTETSNADLTKMEKQAEDNSTTDVSQIDNHQIDVSETKVEQTNIQDENDKLFEEALMSNMKGNHQYAVVLYEKILEENAEHKEALYNLAISKIELNDIKEGCILLNKSLKKGVTQAKDMIYEYCRW